MKTIKLVLSAILVLSLTSCYDFNREQAQKDAESNGKAILLEAESSKKAMIEEAKAKSESAVLAAKARLEVADLDAKAKAKKAEAEELYIKKVSSSLKDNPEYIRYLQVKSVNDSKAQKVFVPTEANAIIIK